MLVSLVGVGVAAAVLAALLAFENPLTMSMHLDNAVVNLPQTLSAYRAWTSGRLPEWSDAFWGGYPLLADPTSAALYVPHLVPLLVTRSPHLRAFDIAAALHLGLLVAGTVELLTLLGLSRAAAATGGILTLLSPYPLFTGLAFFTYLGALCWWPWAFVAAERLARPGTPTLGLAMALGWLALSAQVAVGQPEHGFYCALVTGLWLFTREAGLPWRCRATRVALLGAGAVALAAPQLLPMALYFPETWRVKIPHPELAALWLRDPLALVFPAQGFPNIRPSFYGAATLALAALGCVSRRPRAPFLGVAALVAFLLALGPQTPIYGWLHHIPPFRFFRGPIKFESLVEFATAWLAAVGVDRLWRVRRAAVLAAGTLLVLTAVAERFVSVVWEVRAFAGKASGDANGVAVVQSLARSFLARERGEGPPPLVLDGMTFLGRYAGNLTVVHGMASLTGGPVAMLNRRERQLVELSGPTRAMLDLFGVRFVLVPRRDCTMAVARLRLAVVEESRAFCVLANPTRPPRYVILPQISAVASEEDMIAAVGRDPAGPVPVVNPPSRFAANAPMSGTVELLTYSPGNVRVRARAAGDALLLVRESWVNGWQARVDGAPVPLYPAAGIYFAVPLPAGVHEVQVRYRTPGFRPGLLVALGWLVLIGAYRVHGSRSAGARGEPAEG